MFGALFLFITLIYGFIHFISIAKEERENKIRYRDSYSNTYLSYDGIVRDLDSGKARFMYTKNGDRYMEGDDIGVVNLSQKEREEKYFALSKNHPQDVTVSFYSKEPNTLDGFFTKKGLRYKDLENGEIYVVREDRQRNRFFVTLDNKVVRFTDSYRKNKKDFGLYNEQKEKELAEIFQRDIDKASLDPFWEDPTSIFQKTLLSQLRG